jgi:hypothetical protein
MEKNQNGYPVMPSTPGNNALNTPNSNRQGSGCPGNMTREGCSQSREGGNCEVKENLCLDFMPLAYLYVPMQKFRMLYPSDTALKNGTLFEELDLPVGVYDRD